MDKEQYIKTTQYGTQYFSDEAMTVLHREGGPAVEYANGDKFWWIGGKLHREGAPAVEWADGSGEWYIDGKRHREDGPAMEWVCNGEGWYFINGERVNEGGAPHSA